MKKVKLILATLLVGGIISSCQKDQMNPGAQSTGTTFVATAATDEAYADHQSTYVDQLAQALTESSGTGVRTMTLQSTELVDASQLLPSCATVTRTTGGPNGITNIITVNFGNTPCNIPNHEDAWRQGILVITWSGTGQFSDNVGAVKTVIPQNYFVGETSDHMNRFDFNKTITNMGLNANGNLHFTTSVTDAKLTLWNGGTITWNGNHDIEKILGTAAPGTVFMITGSRSGIDRAGESFTVEITKALMKESNCEWVSSGTKLITLGSDPGFTLDYGDGTCDDLATVTRPDGKSKEIQIDRDGQ